MASALGGFIAGRLRVRWVGLHTDEVYFRDTAHGFLAWAFATIVSASLLASAATSVLGGATQGAVSNPALAPNNTSYYTDMLFRSDNPTTPPAGSTVLAPRALSAASLDWWRVIPAPNTSASVARRSRRWPR